MKTFFIKSFLFAAALIAPIKIYLILIALFIIMDTIAGVWASKALGIKISSSRFSAFISKLFIYNIVAITAYFIDIHLLGEFILLFLSIPMAATKITVLALILNEIYSIDEKFVNVKGHGLWSIFKKLLKTRGLLKKTKDKIEEDTKDIFDLE
jgi:hypothetical protein